MNIQPQAIVVFCPDVLQENEVFEMLEAPKIETKADGIMGYGKIMDG